MFSVRTIAYVCRLVVCSIPLSWVITFAPLSGLYRNVFSLLVPSAAPKLATTEDALSGTEIIQILVRGILPPVALIAMVLGSILTGFVTITESAAVGAGGAMLLAVDSKKARI